MKKILAIMLSLLMIFAAMPIVMVSAAEYTYSYTADEISVSASAQTV